MFALALTAMEKMEATKMSAESDPDLVTCARPTSECLKRIQTDLKSFYKDPLPGIYCVRDDEIVTKSHALIVGPFDTPYEGGFFYFTIQCPENYPADPPKVILQTTGGGTVRFNPNLYSNGKVCLSILGTWSGPSWSPVQSLSSVLLSIQSLMCEQPYHNEPGFEAPNPRDSQSYNDCIRHETLRVAVCEMVTDSVASLQVPAALRKIIFDLFPSFMDSYELTCLSNQVKDGQPMVDPFGGQRGYFNYGSILSRLNEIQQSLPSPLAEEDEVLDAGLK